LGDNGGIFVLVVVVCVVFVVLIVFVGFVGFIDDFVIFDAVFVVIDSGVVGLVVVVGFVNGFVVGLIDEFLVGWRVRGQEIG